MKLLWNNHMLCEKKSKNVPELTMMHKNTQHIQMQYIFYHIEVNFINTFFNSE